MAKASSTFLFLVFISCFYYLIFEWMGKYIGFWTGKQAKIQFGSARDFALAAETAQNTARFRQHFHAEMLKSHYYRAGSVKNSSSNPYKLVFQGEEKDYGCLDYDSAVRPISAVPCCWHPDKYSCQTAHPGNFIQGNRLLVMLVDIVARIHTAGIQTDIPA